MEIAVLPETHMTPDEPLPDGSPEPCAVVQVQNVSLHFGGQRVLNEASFELRTGELVLLRGENGSGKTTLLNVLSGFLTPDSGTVQFRFNGGEFDAIKTRPEQLARQGLGRLWQDIRLFPTMSVLENVMAASPRLIGQNPFLAIVARPWVHRQERVAREQALFNLSLVNMEDRVNSSCDMLSVGQMKRVALARLLQMEAKVMLLDEPLAGLDTASATSLMQDLGRLRSDHRKTFLVVEHRYTWVRDIADRVFTMRGGCIIEKAK